MGELCPLATRRTGRCCSRTVGSTGPRTRSRSGATSAPATATTCPRAWTCGSSPWRRRISSMPRRRRRRVFSLTPRGVFSVRLSFDQAELGTYSIVAIVDGRVVASRSIEVTVIRKPEYQLEVTTDHLAVIAGPACGSRRPRRSSTARRLPGIPLRLDADGAGRSARRTAPARRRPTGSPRRMRTRRPAASSGSASRRPAPSSGDISGHASHRRVPRVGAARRDAATSTSGRVSANARLRPWTLPRSSGSWRSAHGSATRAVEASPAARSPSWSPSSCRCRTKTGTRYDYIEKVVVPIYRYDIQPKVVSTTGIVSGADGRFVLDVAVPRPRTNTRSRFSSKDPAGRLVRRTTTVGAPIREYLER